MALTEGVWGVSLTESKGPSLHALDVHRRGKGTVADGGESLREAESREGCVQRNAGGDGDHSQSQTHKLEQKKTETHHVQTTGDFRERVLIRPT